VRTRLLLAISLFVGAQNPPIGAGPDSRPIAIPKGNITPEELRDLVERLAADDFEGRGSGSPGGKKAGEFVADQLRARGVKPLAAGDNYFQTFERDGGSFRNIVGIVRGTDPNKSNEFVVLGAHYDHCGMGEIPGRMGAKGEIHHGADDNASGTAGVLAAARVIAAKPLPRSVVFILFDAEERGLWGSQHYCAHPLVPIDRTIAMVNLDMIGRSYDGYIFVGGLGSSPAWDEILSKALKSEAALLKNVERDTGGTGPSDHDSFYHVDVPVLFFFTNVHRDYHQPRDTAEKIQYKPMAAAARAALDVVRSLATIKPRPAFTKASGDGLPKGFNALEAAIFLRAKAMTRRLGGLIEAGENGLPRLANIEPAGSRAGLEKGDVILAIARGSSKKPEAFREVRNVEELRVEVEKSEPGEALQLRIRRDDKTLVISTACGEVPEWKHGPAADAGDLPRVKPK
jgi:hypothetical protein